MPSYIRTRSEFTVNSHAAGDQMAPSVATFADGGFIVVWITADSTQDGDDQAIKAQRFDSTGAKVGPEFLVNSSASGAQFSPEVATLPNGNFIVTWVTNISDEVSNGIKAQLFSAAGDPIGAEFKVNLTTGSHFTSNVSALANGGFVISWDDWNGFDMKAQLFDANGARVGGVLTVNTRTSYAQEYGDIVGLAGGGFVATWRTTDPSDDGSGDSVKAQVFDASGAKVGAEFLVNSQKVGNQYGATVEALSGGGFVILWETWDTAQDGSSSALKGQIFSASGAKVGGEFRINTQGADMQRDPQAAGTADGGFVVTWTDYSSSQDGSQSSIKAQAFDATGAKVGGEMLINTLTAGYQTLSDIDTLADGRLILTWASDGGDGSARSIRAQILGTEVAPTLPNTAPVIISNGGGASASLTHDEGVTAVARVVASDDGDPTNLRYSITGGSDAALFTVNALDGLLAFKSQPDHVEGGDNIYDVTVTASDGQLTDSQSFLISLRHVNYVTIVSDGGDDYAYVYADENQTAVTTVTAVDDDGVPLTYAITGGQDAAAFTIDAQTGELRFTVAPDYESPGSSYGENTYYIQVTATDGTRSDTQELYVYVEDVVEPEGFAIVSDGAGEYGQIYVPENGTAVTTVVVSGAEGPVTYEIVGGGDASWFEINSETGALSFVGPPDYETGKYAPYRPPYYVLPDYYNVYNVIVRASDGISSDEQELDVRVEDVDEAPEFQSFQGQDHVTLHLAENTLATIDVGAEDPDEYGYVTYTLEGADAALFETDPYSGGLSFRQELNYEAPIDADGDNVYEVRVVAHSGELSATQSFSITIENDYEPVTVTSHSGSVAAVMTPENLLAVTTVAASGDGTIYYEIAGGVDASWFTIDYLTGVLSFQNSPNYESTAKDSQYYPGQQPHGTTYDVIVRAFNGYEYDDQRLSVRVQDVDEAPIFMPYTGAHSIFENSTAIGTVSARDPDRSSGAITYGIAGGADSAFFEIDPFSGTLKFKQVRDFEAPADADGDNYYEVVVSATSGGLSATEAFSIEILNVNENVAITSNGGGDSATLSVAENGTAVTNVVASSGLSVTYSIVGGADSADFTINSSTGALAFAYVPDFEGTADVDHDNVYEVTVRASNGTASDDQHLSVNLTNVDDVPYFFDLEEGAVESWVMENGEFVGDMMAFDPDGGAAITYAITGGADSAFFVIDPNTGSLSFRADRRPDFEAPADAGADNVYDLEITASQGSWSQARAFTVTVENENERPRITSDGGGTSASIGLDEGQTAVTIVTATDDGPNPVSYSITGGSAADLFTIDSATGALSFITAPDYEAPAEGSSNFYTVYVTASDGELSGFQMVQILVRNVNEGVTITSGGAAESVALTVNENGLAVTTIAGSDIDGDALTYSISGGADASRFAINAQTGALSFVEAPNFEAPADAGGNNVYDVLVSVTDGAFIDSQAIAVTVANLNEAVAITSNGGGAAASVAVSENGTAVATVTASDPDGGSVTYAIAGGADSARFTIDASTGALAFVSAPNFEAPADAGGNNVYDIVVSASDGVTTDTQALAVTVGNVNEGVVITSNGGGAGAAVAVTENATAVATVAAADMDGGAVTYAIAGGADSARFTIDATTGVLAFIAVPNFEAPGDSGGNNVYDVVVSASDGSFADTQAIAVTVGNVNEALAITSNDGGASAAVSVAENVSSVTLVAAADPDGTAATYSIVGGADSARFTINAQTGALQFVVAPDWELPGDSNSDNVYAVVVRASDGQFSDDQALTVSVTNTRDGNNVTGTSSGDSISATSTTVALRTSNEEDLVFGRDGHDNIQGMAGDDELHGEGGNDVLVGGAGADRLLGGLGKDQFTYNALSDSVGASRDMIMDFSRSQGDKISLSAIDANSLLSNNQAFTFIGASAFSNAPGQLRYEISGGMTTIWGDVDGDGVADLQIQLSGSIALVASDFVL